MHDYLVTEKSVSAGQMTLKDVAHMIEHNFKISHATIQIETDDCGGHGHTPFTNDEHE